MQISCNIATVTLVSRANLAVFVFGLLRLYFAQTSCLIWIATLVSRANLAVSFGFLR